MTLIKWQQKFVIGIPDVDHEHRSMIDLINTLHADLSKSAPREEISEFLAEIDTRISAHFALEETVMRDLNYDGYDDHKVDHERLLDDIREIMDNYENDAYFDYEETLSRHLKAWFLNHFATHDARLHRTVEGLTA